MLKSFLTENDEKNSILKKDNFGAQNQGNLTELE